jgi:integrase-like protein
MSMRLSRRMERADVCDRAEERHLSRRGRRLAQGSAREGAGGPEDAHVPFLDELVALIDAAGEQDSRLARVARDRLADKNSTAAKVAGLLAEGRRTSEIAEELGRAKSTVGWHIKRLGSRERGTTSAAEPSWPCSAALGCGQANCATCASARCACTIPLARDDGSPTPRPRQGVRDVELSPDLVKELLAHVDRLRRAGQPTDPESYLFPARPWRTDEPPTLADVNKAAVRATEQLVARWPPPLQSTTPHSLRRTYVSIALLANNCDVLFVMSQVGHSDSKMTTDVYAKLQQRARREHGEAFDRLVRTARERLYGADPEDEQASEARSITTRIRTRERKSGLADFVDYSDREGERD